MLLAWAFLDAVGSGVVRPSTLLLNGAGVTYCMITPVVVGVMLLRPDGFPRFAAVAVASVGRVFGVLNMLTWSSWIRRIGGWVCCTPLADHQPVLAVTAWRRRAGSVHAASSVGDDDG